MVEFNSFNFDLLASFTPAFLGGSPPLYVATGVAASMSAELPGAIVFECINDI